MVFNDESVKRGVKSGWAYTVRVNGETIIKGSGAVEMTTDGSHGAAITEALRYLKAKQYRRAIIVTESMSTMQKIKKENLYAH